MLPPPPDKIFSMFTSLMAAMMAIKAVYHAAVPVPLQRFFITNLQSKFSAHLKSSKIILTVEDKDKTGTRNRLYDDVDEYLGSKSTVGAKKMRVTRGLNTKKLSFSVGEDEVICDIFQGIKIEYKYRRLENGNRDKILGQELIEICFEEKHRDLVLDQYLPFVETEASRIRNDNRVLMVHTVSSSGRWEKTKLIHPSTFDTMAMNSDLKHDVLGDIDRFMSRKEFYKKVGKAWKRGYLLYGPPGTGKSSLAAAVANYLKFDIYDLQLTAVQDDTSLRKLLLGASNASVLLIEDIDRSEKLSEGGKLTMAGLLNSIDGIWSSCSEERILIVTTNDKDKLDPALLRPGRMDLHVYMGYCSFEGFKTLALNYLGLDTQHHLFVEVERLIKGKMITPAQIAGDFMKSDDAEEAMGNLVKLLEATVTVQEQDQD